MPNAIRHLAIGGLTLAAFLVTQEGPTRFTLAPADATLDRAFSSIVSVRELADGRVLVMDVQEQQLLVVDFVAQTAKQVGRRGEGPGECGKCSDFPGVGVPARFRGVHPGSSKGRAGRYRRQMDAGEVVP